MCDEGLISKLHFSKAEDKTQELFCNFEKSQKKRNSHFIKNEIVLSPPNTMEEYGNHDKGQKPFVSLNQA